MTDQEREETRAYYVDLIGKAAAAYVCGEMTLETLVELRQEARDTLNQGGYTPTEEADDDAERIP